MENSNLESILRTAVADTNLINELKCDVRRRLILQSFSIACAREKRVDTSRKPSHSPIHYLISDYLKHAELTYTSSVYKLESNFSVGSSFTVENFLSMLHLTKQDRIYCEALQIQNETPTMSILETLIEVLKRYTSENKTDETIQTDPNPDDINSLLLGIDTAYSERHQDIYRKLREQFETDLLKQRKKLESEFEEMLEEQLSTFKQVELRKMKVELEEKLTIESEEKEQSRNKQYRSQLTALREKEKLLEEKYEQLRSHENSEHFLKRQKLLAESNSVKLLEQQLQKEKEMFHARQKEQMDNLDRLKEDLEKNKTQLEGQRLQFDSMVMQRVGELRSADSLSVAKKERELQLQLQALSEDRASLDKERDQVREAHQEAKSKLSLLKNIELVDYELLQKENKSLKDDLAKWKCKVDTQLAKIRELQLSVARCDDQFLDHEYKQATFASLQKKLEQEREQRFEETAQLKDELSRQTGLLRDAQRELAKFQKDDARSPKCKTNAVNRANASNRSSSSLAQKAREAQKRLQLLENESRELEESFRDWKSNRPSNRQLHSFCNLDQAADPIADLVSSSTLLPRHDSLNIPEKPTASKPVELIEVNERGNDLLSISEHESELNSRENVRETEAKQLSEAEVEEEEDKADRPEEFGRLRDFLRGENTTEEAPGVPVRGEPSDEEEESQESIW